MKIEKLFCVAFAMAMLAGCNKEDDLTSLVNNTTSDVGSKEAYLALSLNMPKGSNTRAATSSTNEEGIKKAMAVLFNDSLDTAQVVNVMDLTLNNNVQGLASAAFPVDSTAKFIMVITNPLEPFKQRIVKGARLSTIRETFALSDSIITAMSNDGEFFMSNLQLVNCLNNIVKYPAASTTGALKTLAESNPVTVYVDRAVAKVTLSASGSLDNPNATVSLEKWRLNVTNRKFNLLPDSVSLSPSKAKYYIDANYDNQSLVGANYFEEFKVDNKFVSFNDTTTLYCLENTMQAIDQKYAYTTQIVLKVKYLPKKDVEGKPITGSWFKYEGRIYTFDQLKLAYENPANTNLKAACDQFAILLETTFEALDSTMLNETTASKTGASGIEYFDEGYCYYKVMIRHDQDNNQLMSLGRYGVVRNNWYELDVKSISEPGLPYPKDPTPDGKEPLDETDDDVQNYLSVTIKVNPWISWKQEVEL